MGKAKMVVTLGTDYDTTRAASLKAHMAKTKGVAFVEFNYTNNKVTLEFDPDRVDLRELKALVTREKDRHARSDARSSTNRGLS